MSDPLSSGELLVRGRLEAMDPFAGRAAPTAREEAARQMEQLFMGLLVKELRKSIPDGLFQGTGSAVYEGLFDRAMASSLSENGGTGLRESILSSLPEGPAVVDLDASVTRSDVRKDDTESRIADSENESDRR